MLWLTRDEGRDVCHLWSGDNTPRVDGDNDYMGDNYLCCFNEGIVMPDPNTCTRLYTETEMRERVAEAYMDGMTLSDEGGPMPGEYFIARRYLDAPTDANWRALARAAGMEDT